MAEVRAIPSAVGAFEAQVIDTSRAYNALLQNANALRKQQAELSKQTEKYVNSSLSDKRTTRPQDNDYLNSLKKDAETYFFNNKSAILRGGAELQTLKEKMGKFTSEVSLSNSLFRTTNSMAPVVSESLKANNAPSKKLQEVWSNYLLPINDEKRKTYTYKNASGLDVDINQLSVLDLPRYKTITDTDVDKFVDTTAKSYNVSNKNLQKGGMFLKDVTTTFSIKSPLHIAGAVQSVFNDYVNKLEEYTTKYESIQKSPELVNSLNEELTGLIDMYKEAGSGAPAEAGFGSIVDIFSKDGVVGVSSPYELAVFDQLKKNAPAFLKSTYDYSTQNQIWRQMSLDLQKQGLYIRLNEKKDKEPLDAALIKDIVSGKIDYNGWENLINTFGSATNLSTGGTIPSKVQFDKQTKTATVVTQKPLVTIDGRYVTDFNEAKNFTPGARVILSDEFNRSGYVDGIYKSSSGVYYYRETKKYDLNPKSTNMRANVVSMLDNIQDAVYNSNTKAHQTFSGLRSQSSTQVIKGVNKKKQ